jgi:hypothetical protein
MHAALFVGTNNVEWLPCCAKTMPLILARWLLVSSLMLAGAGIKRWTRARRA